MHFFVVEEIFKVVDENVVLWARHYWQLANQT
jgi:hypothetical protein